MTGHTSTVGQRVDLSTADTTPHEDYYDSGVPLLISVTGGQVIAKSVHAYTVMCSNCHIAAKFDEKNEPVCPECGVICRGKAADAADSMVRDAKGAGRVNRDGSAT